MPMLSWEVVPTTGETPLKVIFTHGGDVLAEWPVGSEAEAERRVSSALRALGRADPLP